MLRAMISVQANYSGSYPDSGYTRTHTYIHTYIYTCVYRHDLHRSYHARITEETYNLVDQVFRVSVYTKGTWYANHIFNLQMQPLNLLYLMDV